MVAAGKSEGGKTEGLNMSDTPSTPAATGADSTAVPPAHPSAVLERLRAAFPPAQLSLLTNPGPAAEHSLLLDTASARDIALFLRDDPFLKLDFCSNVTGIDWPDKEIIDPATKAKTLQPGYLEAVYHLYSMALKSSAPVIIRLRTSNRSNQAALPSLTPVWRSADFQEREIYDLFGIVFDGHPDLRRLLMWDGFKDHPMRRDYVAPDDFEWEPTPHGAVLDRAKTHYPSPGIPPSETGATTPTLQTPPEAKP